MNDISDEFSINDQKPFKSEHCGVIHRIAVRNLRYVYLNFEVVFFGTPGIFHKERKLLFLNSF